MGNEAPSPEEMVPATIPTFNETGLENAVIGGGCFWCVDAVYQGRAGVKAVISGYTAGKNPNPTYEEVCSGNSGHAEVVQIVF